MNEPVNQKHTLFITGAAGYIGAMLVDIFSKRDDVGAIIALDKEALPDFIKDAPKLTFIRANLSDGIWQKKIAELKPDIIIHTAWQIREMYGKKPLQWKWNIEGSDALFDFAFSTASVKKLIYFSTIASYGAYPLNTIEHRFTEDEPFRKTDYLYAEEKRIAEEHLKEKYEVARKAGSSVEVAVIRPASITGPRGRYMLTKFGLQSALSGKLRASPLQKIISAMLSFVPTTPNWCRQFVHEDDIADIVALFAFNPLKNKFDAFNACPPGDVVRGRDMAHAVGKRAISIHPYLIRIVFFFAWNGSLGRVPTSKGGWKSYSYPIAVDGSKITKLYGYQYKWQSKDAFTKKEGRYAKYVK
jgi:nucleoside-diphosphate-sugar epimerase